MRRRLLSIALLMLPIAAQAQPITTPNWSTPSQTQTFRTSSDEILLQVACDYTRQLRDHLKGQKLSAAAIADLKSLEKTTCR